MINFRNQDFIYARLFDSIVKEFFSFSSGRGYRIILFISRLVPNFVVLIAFLDVYVPRENFSHEIDEFLNFPERSYAMYHVECDKFVSLVVIGRSEEYL